MPLYEDKEEVESPKRKLSQHRNSVLGSSELSFKESGIFKITIVKDLSLWTM